MAVAATERRPGFRRRGLVPYLLLLPGLAWLGVFYVWPTIQMFFISLQEGSLALGYRLTWHWQTYADVFTKYDTQLLRSVAYGVIVTAGCLLISFPLAYFIAVRGGRWKN